jgi:hypothetical protein
MTYQEAQPRAAAIKEAVLSRRMPPWGAVKGFGDFRNDAGLTQDQITLVTAWVETGALKGNNPNALSAPPKFDKPALIVSQQVPREEVLMLLLRAARPIARLRACVFASLIVTAIAAAGCGGANGTLTELQRVRSGDVDLVLLSPHGALRHGKDTFIVEFRSNAGGLVDVGEVRASATMPMPGAPMFGTIDVKRSEVAGRYTADGQFDMAGTWRMTIQWQGPSGQSSVSFAGTVQ